MQLILSIKLEFNRHLTSVIENSCKVVWCVYLSAGAGFVTADRNREMLMDHKLSDIHTIVGEVIFWKITAFTLLIFFPRTNKTQDADHFGFYIFP